jgi:hypothetical protein
MNWWGSGFIPVIIYASAGGFIEDKFVLQTENNLDILTESGEEILVESA